jgi:hypothetical protein
MNKGLNKEPPARCVPASRGWWWIAWAQLPNWRQMALLPVILPIQLSCHPVGPILPLRICVSESLRGSGQMVMVRPWGRAVTWWIMGVEVAR